MTDFAAVDAGDARDLVAMMDATDAWPAVHAARAWVFEQVALTTDALVVDAGCGPGTFGATVQRAGARAIDVDVSRVMALETRRRRADALAVVGDACRLPVRDGAARLVRAERMLQWSAEPARVLAELLRVTAVSGWIAVTDTDWGTFSVDHPDAAVVERFAAGALGWVPHPRLARDLPSALAALGAHDVRLRRDTMAFDAWDPDDPLQRAGPPGLPLRDVCPAVDVDAVAERARTGEFRAAVTMVTVVARRA